MGLEDDLNAAADRARDLAPSPAEIEQQRKVAAAREQFRELSAAARKLAAAAVADALHARQVPNGGLLRKRTRIEQPRSFDLGPNSGAGFSAVVIDADRGLLLTRTDARRPLSESEVADLFASKYSPRGQVEGMLTDWMAEHRIRL